MQCHLNGEPFHCSQDDPRDKETVKTLECAPTPQSIQWLYASSLRKVLCFRFRQRRSSSAQTLLTADAPIPYNLPSFRRAAGIRELQHTLHVLSRIKLFIVESLKENVRTKVNTYGSRSSVDSSHSAFKSWTRAGSLTIINN